MLKNIKSFLNYIDIGFAKSFLGVQSNASRVVKDRLMAKFDKDIDGYEFVIVCGLSTNSEIPKYDDNNAIGRSNGSGVYSSSYRLTVIPDVFNQIITRHYQEILNYLGKDFLYEPPLFFRTLHMPDSLKTYDVYSNIWHQDSHDGDRLLKIFVCLMDITQHDGPFIFLDRKATLKNWSELVERWDFKKISAIPEFSEQQFAVGVKGTYLILNTANCMHRASIPENYRDMMQITLYPKWRLAPDRKVYVFRDGVSLERSSCL
jgi:hypothetical protein